MISLVDFKKSFKWRSIGVGLSASTFQHSSQCNINEDDFLRNLKIISQSVVKGGEKAYL